MHVVYVSPQGVTRVRNVKILHVGALKCVDEVMASWSIGHWYAYLVSMAIVLGGQDKSREVTRQLQPSEVPHKVPEDDGVLVDNTWGGDGLVTLVHQQALQLLPQNQRTQVRHRHRRRGWSWCRYCSRPSTPAALLRGSCRWLSWPVCCRHFGFGIEWHRRVLLCNRITFLGRPEGRHRVYLFKEATGIKDVSECVCVS